jgi:hypothetical protein
MAAVVVVVEQRQREQSIFCCFKGKIKGFGGFFKEIIRGDIWF